MQIRLAKISEARDISNLMAETIKKINGPYYPPEVIDYLLVRKGFDHVKDKINTRAVFCAFEDNHLIGTVSLGENMIGDLYVSAESVGKGIGKLLLEFIENYALSQGLEKVRLYPTRNSYDFYIKQGYVQVWEGYWETEEFKIRNFLLEKDLRCHQK